MRDRVCNVRNLGCPYGRVVAALMRVNHAYEGENSNGRILELFWGAILHFQRRRPRHVIANFVAEDFRRFRDGSALASPIAGELGSYRLRAHAADL